jgi:hypothetical protein
MQTHGYRLTHLLALFLFDVSKVGEHFATSLRSEKLLKIFSKK